MKQTETFFLLDSESVRERERERELERENEKGNECREKGVTL
jgi:hypothetical protein